MDYISTHMNFLPIIKQLARAYQEFEGYSFNNIRRLGLLPVQFDVIAALQPKRLAGHRVVLTAGPTFEPLDPVRGVTNSSSGKMGYALARACAEAGAEVTLVSGPVALPTPRGVHRIDVQTALQMREATKSALAGRRSDSAPRNVFIAVAAVADFRPKASAEHKIKKGAATLTLELEANPDILAEIAAQPDAPFCVGFAAESRDLETYAEGKRVAKKLPLVVGNLVQHGLGGDDNRVTLFDADGAHPLPAADKLSVARHIVSHLAILLEKHRASN